MITYMLDEVKGILTVEPEGQLQEQDFKKLSQAVDPVIEERGGLKGLIIATKTFPGWKDFSGMIAHLNFVRQHQHAIDKVALVTDSKLANVAETLGKQFIKATIKHFRFSELEMAKTWVSLAK